MLPHTVILPLVCLLVAISFVPGLADDKFPMDFERESIVSLNGTWHTVQGHEDKDAWKPDVADKIGPWQPAEIPGTLIPGVNQADHKNVRTVWARKTFPLSMEQSRRNAALKWNSIRYGATVWINGHTVASHPVTGPHTVLLPAGVLREGDNQIIVRTTGWAGIPKSKTGYPLIPAGSGTQGWGRKDPGILDHIWIEFYDQVYMKWVLAMPDLDKRTVTFRTWFDAGQPMPPDARLTVKVLSPSGGKLAGQTASALNPTKSPAEITVPIRDIKPWTPETPVLYTAELRLERAGRTLDAVRFTFGMRTIEVKDGRYRLNNQPLWLRGSNLVCEWFWGGEDSIFNKNTKAYIVDEARVMNLNCFRTHTLPPPTSWLDVSDRHGTMILAEFPVLYNYRDFKFTPDENEIFHKNALIDATGWVTKMWNHPSIVTWVISNETPVDHAWEMGPYRDHVKALDPTRPVLRSGEDTAETDDMHICNNLERAEGQWVRTMIERGQKRDPNKTLSNTEYMNYLKSREDIATRLLGDPKHPDERLVFAEFAMEHTEVMRQQTYDLLLPYMYAGWTRLRTGNQWRPEFPTPMAAALHSSMSPVLASLDLYDRNFVAGRDMTTTLVLINETPKDVKAKVDVYVTPKDPLFVPDEDALKAAVSHETIEVTFKGHSLTRRDLRWQVPAKEGNYFLAAVTRLPGQRPVVSQRVVRAIDPAITGKDLLKKRVLALGVPADALNWLKEQQIPCATSIRDGKVDGDVVAVGFVGSVAAEDRAQAPAILEFVKNGGKLVILAQDEWDWTELVDFEMDKGRASRAFAYPDVKHPLLTNIDPEFLKRWNGLPNEIADHTIKGDVLKRAMKLLWMEKPDTPIAVSIPEGKGEIIICLLDFRRRLDPAQDQYDPVAERMMVNLLQR